MADITFQELTGFGLATVLPHRGKEAETATLAGSGLTLWATGPGQSLAFAPHAEPAWGEALEERLAPTAHVIDQSSGYSIFALSGCDAARMLQKGLPIDLSDHRFPVDHVAVSVIAHIGVIVHRAAPDLFHVATFRSFADSFHHWLDLTAATL